MSEKDLAAIGLIVCLAAFALLVLFTLGRDCYLHRKLRRQVEQADKEAWDRLVTPYIKINHDPVRIESFRDFCEAPRREALSRPASEDLLSTENTARLHRWVRQRREPFTLSEAFREALGVQPHHIRNHHSHLARRIFEQHGCKRRERREGDGPIVNIYIPAGYIAPASVVPPADITRPGTSA